MILPEELIKSLDGIEGFDQEAFIHCHLSEEAPTSVRLNSLKLQNSGITTMFDSGPVSPVPWTADGYYLDNRPSFTFDPLFHAGAYYVQEASGMFLEHAFKATIDLSQPLRVLDLCAAPGGKSTLIQSMITDDSLLVSNEVIRSRAGTLKDNIIKWGRSNTVVTSNDPSDFSNVNDYFDVIVIDAPCSGSGLFRKDEEAIQSWNKANVNLCSQRQQRILSDIWPALKKNGILIYCTCSYSREENEDISDWFMQTFPLTPIRISLDSAWNITEVQTAAGAWGYRFWPYRVKGEGFFLSCFQKTDGVDQSLPEARRTKETLNKKEIAFIDKWINPTGQRFIKHESTVYGWPTVLADEMDHLLESLRVIYSGTIIGELVRDKLIPAHELAMSNLVRKEVQRSELDFEQAIQYLQKKNGDWGLKQKGWQLVSFRGQNLGWVNVLENRINNYYPKELRILKEKP